MNQTSESEGGGEVLKGRDTACGFDRFPERGLRPVGVLPRHSTAVKTPLDRYLRGLKRIRQPRAFWFPMQTDPRRQAPISCRGGEAVPSFEQDPRVESLIPAMTLSFTSLLTHAEVISFAV